MGKDWTHVRIRRKTQERLLAECKKLTLDESPRTAHLERSDRFGVSVDALLAYMLDQVEAHRVRAREARKASAARRAGESVE